MKNISPNLLNNSGSSYVYLKLFPVSTLHPGFFFIKLSGYIIHCVKGMEIPFPAPAGLEMCYSFHIHERYCAYANAITCPKPKTLTTDW